jgi:hypothetical protein
MGPDNFDGPSHNELFDLADMLSKLGSFRNIGWVGIGPLIIVDKPSHILFRY